MLSVKNKFVKFYLKKIDFSAEILFLKREN